MVNLETVITKSIDIYSIKHLKHEWKTQTCSVKKIIFYLFIFFLMIW